jgi:hypothetical protein
MLPAKEETMPLQNRVDPFGRIHAVPERGMFTGNRGVIHDPETKTLLSRRWTTKAWLICTCDYKGMRRDLMGRNARTGSAGWTELFFLDEPTALAAGHRPCFLCRRNAARDYQRCFATALMVPGASAPEIDARLHRERPAAGVEAPELSRGDVARLPDGAMFASGDTAHAVKGRQALPWSFAGYGGPRELDEFSGSGLRLLTPATTVEALGHGYRPVWHATAA